MTPERYREVKEHFHALSELDTEARRSYLDAIDDRSLRADVASLFEGSDTPFLESPLVGLVEPSRVGPYAIVREIGRGGMGVVYLAERGGKQFALKVIKRGFDTDAITARFRRESRILGAFDHPNIARIIDGGATDDGRPFFAMEYIDGSSLDDHAAKVSLRERLAIFESVCRAVHYAHERGVIHRDLKPANIHVTREGCAKLLDFGIAKVVDDASTTMMTTLTATGQNILTPAYASPEQVTGDPITPASDVYSLGVILFELMTSRRPFGDVRTPQDLANVVARKRPARPSSLVRELPRGVDDVAMMCIARNPQERYASAAELADDIGRILRAEAVLARPRAARVRRSIVAAATAAVVTAATSVLLVHPPSAPAPAERATFTTYNQADVLVRIRDAEQEAAAHPQSAQAWAFVARRRASAFFLGFDRSYTNRSRAAEALARAVSIAPDSPDVREAKARVAYHLRGDYEMAEAECRWLLRHAFARADTHALMAYIRRREGAFDDAVRDLRAAARLAPSAIDYEAQIGLTAIYRRRYDEASREFKRALQLAPAASDLLSSQAETLWLTGAPVDAAKPLLANITDEANVSSFGGTARYRYHLFSREYLDAARDLESSPVNAYILYEFGNVYMPRDLLVGNAYALAGKTAVAQRHYDAARAQLEAAVVESPDESRLHASLGMVYAGLGRGEDAMREATRATSLMPVSLDAISGAVCLLDRAKVEAAVGKTKEALDDIAWLLEHPAPLTPAMLRIDPAWDPLRKDPRFVTFAAGLPTPYATNVDAHNAYVQARFEYTKRRPDSVLTAERLLRRAVEIDPKYEAAWAALADTYNAICFYGISDRRIARERQHEAVTRALEIDPNSAPAHAANAIYLQMAWDWANSDRDYLRAIELNPKYAAAHHWYAFSLTPRGRFDEAIREIREAQEADPMTPIFVAAEGVVRFNMHDYDAAIGPLREVMQRDPKFYLVYSVAAMAYTAKGEYAKAIVMCDRARSMVPDEHIATAVLSWAYAKSGRRAEALALAKHCETAYAHDHLQPTLVAIAWAGLGERDRALQWLERARVENDQVLPLLAMNENPPFDILRGDPRYADLQRRMKLR